MALLVASWTGARGGPTRAAQGQLVLSPSSLLAPLVEALKAAGVAHAPAEDWGPSASLRFQERREAVVAILATVAAAHGFRLHSVIGPAPSEQPPTTEYVFAKEPAAAADPPLRHSHDPHAVSGSVTPPSLAAPVAHAPAVAALVAEDRSLRGSGTGPAAVTRPGTPGGGGGAAAAAAAPVEVGPRLTSDAPYFHGPISDAAAAELLESQPPGAYLARNSTSSPATCIIISCKEGSSSKILHFRLWKLSTGRFSLEKAPAAKDPVFPSLQEFVTAHPNHFKVPVEKAASGYGAFDE